MFKKNHIEVFDDVIPNNIQNYFENFIINNTQPEIQWLLQSNLSGVQHVDSDNFGFSCSLFDGRQPENINRIYSFRFLQIPYILASYLKLNIIDLYSTRLFLTTPSKRKTPIYEGIHTDLTFKHQVMLYYLNDSEGETVFFEKDKKTEITRVSPKKGRIALFSGDIPHCNSLPDKNIRVILNTNLLLEPF
jgi:hypothetical protein